MIFSTGFSYKSLCAKDSVGYLEVHANLNQLVVQTLIFKILRFLNIFSALIILCSQNVKMPTSINTEVNYGF